MKGIIKEDMELTILQGYIINDIPVHPDSEEFAKNNLGKKVEYELNYDGYRQFGMFTKDFYKKAKIIIN